MQAVQEQPKFRPSYEVLSARDVLNKKNNISEQELKELAGNLTLDSFEPAEDISKEVLKEAMRALIESDDPINKLTAQIKGQILEQAYSENINSTKRLIELTEKAKDKAGKSLFDHYRGNLAVMNHLTRKNQLFYINIDNKAVSTIGYRKAKAPSEDGREIFEIKQASTLPEYRGRGCYKDLAKIVLERIRILSPDAIITRITKNEIVKRNTQKLPEWRSAGLINSKNKIAQIMAIGISPEELEEMAKEGYEVFYFDPKEEAREEEVAA